MLYVTIIVVAVLIIGCIITCNYFKHIYNPDVFENNTFYNNLFDIKNICNNIFDKLELENNADDDSKHKYYVSRETLINAIENINDITSVIYRNDKD